MTARALLIVPPFIKYNAGPLLGPALLQAAARSHGHNCHILDLNAHWIQRQKAVKFNKHYFTNDVNGQRLKPLFYGDHNKDETLSEIERAWNAMLLSTLSLEGAPASTHETLRRIHYGFLDHDDVEVSALNLARSPFGALVHDQLAETCEGPQHLPEALVAWGGPHISGLGNAISQDLNKRTALAADVFVQGHAEETFVGLLDQLGSSSPTDTSRLKRLPAVLSGSRGKFMHLPLMPTFENLECYSSPVTLPAQSSLGCSYGKCAFCTYPAMEPKPVQLDLEMTVGSVVQQAVDLGTKKCSGISLKDSLVTTNRLTSIANCVKGRVKWSACTKLGKLLSNTDTLLQLSDGGLRTLEVGLESLLLETQLRVGKIQEQALFEEFIASVSNVPDLTVVVNYMTGFPWENPTQAQEKLNEVHDILDAHLGNNSNGEVARAKVEHNTFELERLSRMAQNPCKYGIRTEGLKMWPWASVIEQS